MIESEGSGDLQALVKRATTRQSKCWASNLTEDLHAFVIQLEAIEAEEPGRVNRAEVCRILVERGIKMSHEAVKRHFRGDCHCER